MFGCFFQKARNSMVIEVFLGDFIACVNGYLRLYGSRLRRVRLRVSQRPRSIAALSHADINKPSIL